MKYPLVNDGQHIAYIMDKVNCNKHHAAVGIPCFHITRGSIFDGNRLAGICGTRIKKAGYNGKISPRALQLTGPHSNKN